MIRKAMYVVTLGTAVGVPYVLWNGPRAMQSASNWWSQSEEEAGGNPAPDELERYGPADDLHDQQVPSAGDAPPIVVQPLRTGWNDADLPPMAGESVERLEEVLRMDISPAWVTARWPRVTTTLAETQLDGMRVALVTGTSPGDLIGSLTYYFDDDGRLQRLAFQGTTGDAGRLVELLVGQRRFQREASLGGELYTRQRFGRATGICRIRPLPVIRADMPNTRLEVMLEINRPGGGFGLSATASQLLEQDRQANLWGR